MRHPTLCALTAASALTVLGLAGCGDSGGSPDSTSTRTATTTVTTTAAPSATETATGTATSSASSSASSSGSGCATAGLRFRLLAGEGAAGSTYYPLQMTNTGQQTCSTRGYGGVSMVATATGSPIGAPADRTPGSAKLVTLQPGQSATATLRVVEAGNYDAGKCHPRTAAGLRIYPPDETHSTFVQHRLMACGSGSVHLLSLTPYAAK